MASDRLPGPRWDDSSRATAGPYLCLVTDRRRLSIACRAPLSEWRALLLAQIAGAIRGGVDLIQIREPDLEARDLAEFVGQALRVLASSPGRLLINDRLDIALATGVGVHLREASLPTAAARRLSPKEMTMGRSVHSVESALHAGPVDYLIAGTVFHTETKSGTSLLGIDGLAAIVQAASPVPVLAIGGIGIANAGAVLGAGARGMAGIGAFIPGPGEPVDSAVQKLTKNLRNTFDTVRLVS